MVKANEEKGGIVMKRLLGVGVVLLLVMGVIAVIAYAEPGSGCRGNGPGMGNGYHRMYDPAKVETIKGQVASVEQISGRRGRGSGVVLNLKTETETLSVHLGPSWYLDKQNMKIAAGDVLEISGARSIRGSQNIFLAAEVKKGSDTLKLRSENGVPLWAGRRCRNNKS
jgi:hypothetical protein